MFGAEFEKIDDYKEKQEAAALNVQKQIEWHIARFGYVTGSEVHRIAFIEAKKANGTSRSAKLDWLKNNAAGVYAELLEIADKQGKDIEKLPVAVINERYDNTPAKLVPSEKTLNYAYELADQLTLDLGALRQSESIPRWLDNPSSSTRWGHDNEPLARKYFADANPNFEVLQMAQVQHPTLPFVRFNPDGVIKTKNGKTGVLEIKCPYTLSKHGATMRSRDINDEKHLKQILLGMICLNADFAVFVSFDPRRKDGQKMVTVTKTRQDLAAEIWQMEKDLRMFWSDVYMPVLNGMGLGDVL